MSSDNSVLSLKAFYCNAQSIKNKLSDLHDLLYSFEFEIIAISESWLSSIVVNGILDPRSKYTIYRRDRESKVGGGVCIFVSNVIHSSGIVTDILLFPGSELVGCSLHVGNSCLTLLCFYCAPNVDRVNFTKCLDGFKLLLKKSNRSAVLIFGDFNLPNISWSSPQTGTSSQESEFVLFCQELGLHQVNTHPTRENSILDLVLTDDPLLIANLTVQPSFGTSDHDSLFVSIVLSDLPNSNCKFQNNMALHNIDNTRKQYLWSKAAWNSIAELCSQTCWRSIFTHCRSANDCWMAFCDVIHGFLTIFVPFKSKVEIVTSKKSKKRHPKNVSKLMLKKKHAWQALRKNKNVCNKARYKECIALINKVKANNELLYESKIIESKNIGAIYKHINKRLSHKSGIAPLLAANNKLVTDNLTKAEILNDHFVSVGTKDNSVLPEITRSINTIESVYFERHEIITVINKLKSNSSSGPDGFAPVLYKSLKYQLANPLAMMFSLILQFGSIPDEWKMAIVSPIFKKGSSSDPNNYRPISLTCVCCKIFESILKNHILQFLEVNSIVTKSQHGFLMKHSTTTNLLESLNDWSKSLEQKQSVKVLFVDFEKAFDKVSIPKLIHKLESIGITGMLLKCIISFLTNRLQSVKIADVQSSYKQLVSGVPQGSVLGPFLFLLFINDLPDVFNDTIVSKLFADDLKVYDTVKVASDNDKLQVALNRIIEWSNSWQLSLSVSKCGSLLIVGNTKPTENKNLFIGENKLNDHKTSKDLGVLIDSRLCFSEHIDSVVAKANQRIFLLFKAFRNRDLKLMIFAFKVYIIPILEYCSPIWSPYRLSDIDRIENVQRSFTKKLNGLKDLSYSERLVACDLPTLELRRLRTDLLLCFKIVHKYIAIEFNDFFEYEHSKFNTRGHLFKLRIPKILNSVRKNFFSVRIIPVWNSLPTEVVTACSCDSFMKQLKAVSLNRFLSRCYDESLNE